jgi:hypothetical protein
MLSILNDSQKAIVDTITMQLDTKQSLVYLKEHGFEMNERKFFRQKKKIESLKLKRLCHSNLYDLSSKLIPRQMVA